ncbi:MAG: hypothetical protein OIF55_16865 [Amphritea sp.]|nr:hypothetical protein [Amphritea sp.]
MKAAAIDLVGLVGLAGIGYGAFLIYEPAAYIVTGACLVAYAVKAAPNVEGGN